MRSLLLLMLSAALLASCLRKENDAPPDTRGYDPNLPVNMTIADLKSRFAGPSAKAIDSDWTIYGIVTADDRSGNLYKQINIEDSTGGITLLIDNNSLYGDYPVGRKVYVKLKGLYYGFYNLYPQVGGQPGSDGDLSNIPTAAINGYIIKATFPNPVTPQKFADLSTLKSASASKAMLNRLVEIENIEFIPTDTGKTYADAPTIASGTDRKIKDCAGNTVVVRTSGYASFQAYKLPKGRGTLRAIYSVYRSTPQLVVVDTAGVALHGARCDGSSGGGGGGTVTLLSETFGSATSGAVTLTGWTNVAQTGSQKWTHSNQGSTSNPYARISAFGTGDTAVASWLVTPAIGLAGAVNPVLTFRNANGYSNGATLKVYASNNFSGDVTTATWTQLNPTLATLNATGFSSFTSSGNISLSAFTSGNVWIAWKYEGGDFTGTANDKTTTWEIDDVKVVKN